MKGITVTGKAASYFASFPTEAAILSMKPSTKYRYIARAKEALKISCSRHHQTKYTSPSKIQENDHLNAGITVLFPQVKKIRLSQQDRTKFKKIKKVEDITSLAIQTKYRWRKLMQELVDQAPTKMTTNKSKTSKGVLQSRPPNSAKNVPTPAVQSWEEPTPGIVK